MGKKRSVILSILLLAGLVAVWKGPIHFPGEADTPDLSSDNRRKQEKILQSAEKECVIPERILLTKPVVTLNGSEGNLGYRWDYDCIAIDETAILLSIDCYFPEEVQQQKIFYLAEAPDFVPQEVFRQNTGSEGSSILTDAPELLEGRLFRPLVTKAGYIYEADGELYCLAADFQKTTLLCDLRETMGGMYEFSPWLPDKNKCDVTADASRMLACTDEGLYEYDLVHGDRTLLEPAALIPHETDHIEGDCDCGETGFVFSGPIEAEYAPDDQGYAFLTGTEYGEPTAITLKAGNGNTLYQKELEYVGGFEWLETENAFFLAVFYRDNTGTWMDRVDGITGEKTTFAVPKEVFYGGGTYLCAAFLDEDRLIYCKNAGSASWERTYEEKSTYEIYRLSDGERQEADRGSWKGSRKIKVLYLGGYEAIIIRY